MTTPCDARVDFTVLDAAALLAIAMGGAPDRSARPLSSTPKVMTDGAVTGLWRSPDGTVQLRLHTDGTYAGEVAGRKQAVRGTYDVEGAEVVLHDESGLNTPVQVHEGELEMAGHRLLPV
ncbi:Atu4866 domain-containing protein [Actinoplanes sp. DH11]|uniref:Atu4866 domain-containing protein n=1 Tax=Actinoplanes sp. DH11 TaxID=2857011 RepID=UPI001E54D610|nr:Atu4866 domain-containing protein [Actinoplanes sp. DH11]